MAAWLATTYATEGTFSVETTGGNTPMLVGNVVALLSPVIFIPILTYVPPFKSQKYDWISMAAISKGDDSDFAAATLDAEQARGQGAPLRPTVSQAEERKQLDRSAKIARVLCVTLALCFIILWPMTLFGTRYVFNRAFFTGKSCLAVPLKHQQHPKDYKKSLFTNNLLSCTGWIVVGIIWLFFSTAIVVFLPLFESRKTIAHTTKSIIADLTGKRTARGRPEVMQGEALNGEGATPPNEVAEKPAEKEGGK